jgi:hypothetical protein
MVTNKKSQAQIAEDLEIFLGGIDAASQFSSWLIILITSLSINKIIHKHLKYIFINSRLHSAMNQINYLRYSK